MKDICTDPFYFTKFLHILRSWSHPAIHHKASHTWLSWLPLSLSVKTGPDLLAPTLNQKQMEKIPPTWNQHARKPRSLISVPHRGNFWICNPTRLFCPEDPDFTSQTNFLFSPHHHLALLLPPKPLLGHLQGPHLICYYSWGHHLTNIATMGEKYSILSLWKYFHFPWWSCLVHRVWVQPAPGKGRWPMPGQSKHSTFLTWMMDMGPKLDP